jgi:hypothetical protein
MRLNEMPIVLSLPYFIKSPSLTLEFQEPDKRMAFHVPMQATRE